MIGSGTLGSVRTGWAGGRAPGFVCCSSPQSVSRRIRALHNRARPAATHMSSVTFIRFNQQMGKGLTPRLLEQLDHLPAARTAHCRCCLAQGSVRRRLQAWKRLVLYAAGQFPVLLAAQLSRASCFLMYLNS